MADNDSFLDKVKRAFSGEPSSYDQDEAYYRGRHTTTDAARTSGAAASASTPAAPYDAARPAYQVGHLAGGTNEYQGRQFEEVEPELRRGYEAHAQDGQAWDAVRDHARDAYARGQEQRLVLSEEQLTVGKRQVQAGEVNVRKTVDTEHVQQQVGLSRDEVSIERRPLSGADATNLTIGEETIRVPLTREEAVVEKRIVPIEEVVVHTKAVTENQTIEDTVRKERLVTDGLDQQGGASGTPASTSTNDRGI